MSDRLTVKEFAIRAGVSPQRIYKLLAKDNGLNNGLSNRLKPYIIIENNQKYLDIEALKLFEEKNDSQQVEHRVEQRTSEEIPQGVLIEQLKAKDSQIAELNAAIKAAQEHSTQQLSEKDKQIAELTATIKAEQEHSAQLATALENTTAALTAAQALHAGTIKQQLTEQHEPNSDLQSQEEQLIKEPTEDPSKQKLSFLQRLFRKNKT